MEKKTTFLHLLVFRCSRCGNPVPVFTLASVRSLEGADAKSYRVNCDCGNTQTLLGIQAKKHWAEPWLEPELRSRTEPLPAEKESR